MHIAHCAPKTQHQIIGTHRGLGPAHPPHRPSRLTPLSLLGLSHRASGHPSGWAHQHSATACAARASSSAPASPPLMSTVSQGDDRMATLTQLLSPSALLASADPTPPHTCMHDRQHNASACGPSSPQNHKLMRDACKNRGNVDISVWVVF